MRLCPDCSSPGWGRWAGPRLDTTLLRKPPDLTEMHASLSPPTNCGGLFLKAIHHPLLECLDLWIGPVGPAHRHPRLSCAGQTRKYRACVRVISEAPTRNRVRHPSVIIKLDVIDPHTGNVAGPEQPLDVGLKCNGHDST